jgi:hypothetical protein
MLKYALMAAILAGSAYASDFRISVGIGYQPSPVYQTVVVERPSVVWVPPVYENRVDAEGNIYVVLVRQGYYQEIRPVIYAPAPIYYAPAYRPMYAPCPRPSFGFGFSFGSSHGGHHR